MKVHGKGHMNLAFKRDDILFNFLNKYLHIVKKSRGTRHWTVCCKELSSQSRPSACHFPSITTSFNLSFHRHFMYIQIYMNICPPAHITNGSTLYTILCTSLFSLNMYLGDTSICEELSYFLNICLVVLCPFLAIQPRASYLVPFRDWFTGKMGMKILSNSCSDH